MGTIDAIKTQIESLQDSYNIELKYFLLDVQSEQTSSNYEKNLINKLIEMQRIKSEIKALTRFAK